MSYQSEDFSVDLRKCTAPPNYIWVNSGFSTCAPAGENVTGAAGCFSPPYAAEDTKLSFSIEADGHYIEDTGNKGKEDCGLLYAGGTWQPDKIVRKGTYHYRTQNGLISLAVESELVPLFQKAGFLVKIRIKNRASRETALKVNVQFDPGHPRLADLSSWDFMPPKAGGSGMMKVSDCVWENEEIRVTLVLEDCGERSIGKDQIYECQAAVVYTKAGESAGAGRLSDWQKETEEAWKARLRMADRGIPALNSNIPGLTEYYHRSLISGLVCLWENDAFVTNPFPATSGMDGGSICCYPWDVAGYSARTLVMLLGEKTLDFLNKMLDSGIDRHICMSLKGDGQGWCSYSYSMWSLMNLYWTVVTMTGKGLELFDNILTLFQAEEERLEEWEDLKDYGRQHNLLEMRSCGYEYVVPSPNAERAWCYDRLSDIGERLGRKDTAGWRSKAEAIRTSLRENLWDEEAGWFRCIHPEHHVEYIYSIQMYDALRFGVCDGSMTDALAKHLVDGRFLGAYGVSSISAEDELHYELNDPDWSGGGSYSGEGPELAETLWKAKRPELAWDVLRRHFWLGTMAPYIPQEHYCDKPGMPANKRANIIAGVTGLQAVLFGLAGFEIGLDGGLTVDPAPAPEGWYEVKGFPYRDKPVDLWIDQERMKISVDHEVIYEGEIKKTVIQ